MVNQSAKALKAARKQGRRSVGRLQGGPNPNTASKSLTASGQVLVGGNTQAIQQKEAKMKTRGDTTISKQQSPLGGRQAVPPLPAVRGGVPCLNLDPCSVVSTSQTSAYTNILPVTALQNLGRVDHYFQGGGSRQQSEGSEFLRQLFRHPHSSCIAVKGNGEREPEGYVVNRAFIAEAHMNQEKLRQMIELLKKENERLKSNQK